MYVYGHVTWVGRFGVDGRCRIGRVNGRTGTETKHALAWLARSSIVGDGGSSEPLQMYRLLEGRDIYRLYLDGACVIHTKSFTFGKQFEQRFVFEAERLSNTPCCSL